MTNSNDFEVLHPRAGTGSANPGAFAAKPQSAPGVELTGSSFDSPDTPVESDVYLQRWDGDYAVTVNTVRVNFRSVLDATPLNDLETAIDSGDQDALYYDAVEAGRIEHDGPFHIDLSEDIEDYRDWRRSNGLESPVAGASDRIRAEQSKSLTAKLERLATVADNLSDPKAVEELQPGDVLVRGASRLTVENVEHSSSMPGFMAVETEFGTLYLDPERQVQVLYEG